jgi:adenine-specific DNA-methyltransferase
MKIYTKTEAKEKVAQLIKKFESLSPSVFKKYNEANTRKDFILPLFKYLGWDVYNDSSQNEVVEEEANVAGWVDYSFRINNITQFLLEAKAIPEDLNKLQWAQQAIEYGWNKGIPWVVLTDFEGLKIFNSEWKKDQPRPNIDLSYKDYLEKFDKLWLLSKESFEENKLDTLLSEFGITSKRENVNDILAKELIEWRQILTKNLKQWNDNINDHDLDEAVQRILDRLIFIRFVEDRGIEDKTLWETFQRWKAGHKQKDDNFIKVLKPIFNKFDKKYNSNLFAPHLCEDLEIDSGPFYKIIPQLYGEKQKGLKYRFNAIDADVLGNVYEQYLGAVQQREGEKSKRKKQGIYYTPTYIVEYIVQNTLGKLLKEKQSLSEKGNLKILDPACGSGSFLIKAFEVLDNHLKQVKNQKTEDYKSALRKYAILTNNIYGVDLDEQAVEIARLNLLLKALVPNNKLPLLTDHMKIGNSLISDPKITDKAFNWQKEFPDIFKGKNPGFDVIIGNPPYIFARGASFSNKEKKYYLKNYKLTHYQLNTFLLFIERSFNLLNSRGYFGFIIPNTWLTIDTFSGLRKFLLNNINELQIINIHDKVFEGASVDTCLLLFRKGKPKKITLGELSEGKLTTYGKFSPAFFKKNNYIINISLAKNKEKVSILEKIKKRSTPLKANATISTGLKAYQTGKGNPQQTDKIRESRAFHSRKKKNKTYMKYLTGRNVMRYKLTWSGEYLSYGEWLAEPRKSVPFKNQRILVRQIPSPPPYSINSVFLKKDYLNDINSMVVFDFKTDPLFLLAVLNSRITTFWFTNTFDKFQRKTFPQFKVKELALFPIPKANNEQRKSLAKKANLMTRLYKDLEKMSENSDKWHKLKGEIEKLDKKIDQEVYKLYGLTKKEIEMIEKNI